mgnify:CR=1 FL=1
MDKISLLKKIKKLEKECNTHWVYPLPGVFSDLREAVLDNDYTNALGLMKDECLKFIFSDRYEDVCWFLYDWDGKPTAITLWDGEEYSISCDEDFFRYIIGC